MLACKLQELGGSDVPSVEGPGLELTEELVQVEILQNLSQVALVKAHLAMLSLGGLGFGGRRRVGGALRVAGIEA